MKLTTDIERIEAALKRNDISVPEFQRALKIQSQHWNNWKKRGVPGNRLIEISDKLGVTAEWIAKGKNPPDWTEDLSNTPQQPTGAKTIESNAEWLGGFETWDNDTPLRDDEVELPFFREVELAAGNGRSEIIENHGLKLRFAKSTLKKQNVDPASAACVTVSGNSMEPVLPDGATIGIDTSKRQIKDGDIYAIDHDGHLRVKVLYRLPGGKVRLRSFNSDEWPDELVTQEEFKILGRVFWWSVLR